MSVASCQSASVPAFMTMAGVSSVLGSASTADTKRSGRAICRGFMRSVSAAMRAASAWAAARKARSCESLFHARIPPVMAMSAVPNWQILDAPSNQAARHLWRGVLGIARWCAILHRVNIAPANPTAAAKKATQISQVDSQSTSSARAASSTGEDDDGAIFMDKLLVAVGGGAAFGTLIPGLICLFFRWQDRRYNDPREPPP